MDERYFLSVIAPTELLSERVREQTSSIYNYIFFWRYVKCISSNFPVSLSLFLYVFDFFRAWNCFFALQSQNSLEFPKNSIVKITIRNIAQNFYRTDFLTNIYFRDIISNMGYVFASRPAQRETAAEKFPGRRKGTALPNKTAYQYYIIE